MEDVVGDMWGRWDVRGVGRQGHGAYVGDIWDVGRQGRGTSGTWDVRDVDVGRGDVGRQGRGRGTSMV